MVSTHHADKRRQILHAAFDVFGEAGYRKTTVQAIADRVGVTPGTLYNYFKDKEELFLASLSSVWDQFGSAVDSATDNQQISWTRRARELFRHAETLLRKSHLLLVGSLSSEQRRVRLRNDLDRVSQQLMVFLDEGRQAGLAMLPSENSQALVTLKLLLAGALWTLAVVDSAALETELARLRASFLQELEGLEG